MSTTAPTNLSVTPPTPLVRAVDTLVALLSHPDPHIRIEAAKALMEKRA